LAASRHIYPLAALRIKNEAHMRTRALLFVLLHAAVCRGQSLLCNTVSALGADFARQFAKQQYPLVDGRALDSAFRDTCLAQTKANPTFYCEPLAPYPALRATCLSYSSCTTSCGRSITQATRTYCLDGCNTAIQSFCNTLTDRRALYNLPIAAPSASFADYNVQIDGMAAPGALDYSSRLSATTTTWFAVKFSNASVRCNTTDTALCKNPLLALQPAFFSSSFAIAYDTFVMDNAKQYPDLQYHPTFRAKVGARMLRLGTARSNDAAFWTRGCTPPEFTVRVAFAATKMPATGYSVQPGTQVACYNRTIYIMDMREETPAYNCRFPHYVNTLRNMLDSPAKGETYEIRRQAAVKSMQAEYFAYSADGTRAVLYSLSQINNIFDCVGPAAGIGGVWTIGSPGTCTACTTRTTSSHMQTRYCNRSLVADQNRDCCYRCMPGYMMVLSPLSGNQQVCVSECKRNTQYSNGRCEPCPRGQFSAGGNDRCLTCDALGFVNARVDSVRGCVPCDPRFLASVDLCVPCPASQIVIAGACTPCVSLGAYFLSPTLLQCQPCGPGTFMQLPTTTTCQTCPLNTYLNATAATACKYCASGYQSVPNRTVCAPCPAINRTLLPYSQYFQRGCNMRCMSGSYGTNPYAAGGCRSCASVTLPVGTYALSASCADPRPCTNAPAAGAVYTAAAPLNTATCPYACQIGYREPTCTPCAYAGTGYNPLLHAPIAGTGCPFDCVPGLFRDGTRACTKACVQLVDELANGNIRARVRDYPAGVRRPHYVLGVCGSTSTFPTAEIPFLRKAWWAYLSDYATSTCGNALLETGEACDDGNAVAGDGCSSTCQVETGSYWDCDVVGAPCLPNCGWKTQTSDQWGISLRGFLLPPCSPTSGCSCQQLSYYNVSLMPVGSRRPWMVQHLVPCNCDGNIMRTLPYEVKVHRDTLHCPRQKSTFHSKSPQQRSTDKNSTVGVGTDRERERERERERALAHR
jgi:cysteine-rich repeat protein